MSILRVENLCFTYAGANSLAVNNVSLEINQGEILLVAGRSGSGKSTLLGLLKPEIRGKGQMTGEIFLDGQLLPDVTNRETVAKIGYLCQSPENQIVTDKVYRELTYGLENLGLPQPEIMARCAEISAFLGISHLFRKNTWELSGGQKQVVNLASLLVMEPKVLLLDEPTSKLDPVAAEEFLYLLQRVKNEFGLAIILVEHDLDKVVHLCDKMCILDQGQVQAYGTPREVLEQLPQDYRGTTAWRLWRGSKVKGPCPITLSEIRQYVIENFDKKTLDLPQAKTWDQQVLECKDLWFRYAKGQEYCLRGVDIVLHKGEFRCIMGGNGCGKSTLLKAISNKEKGVIVSKGQRIAKLPQDVTELFLQDTVLGELEYVERDRDRIMSMCQSMGIEALLDRNPLKLSGGEQRKVALAKVMLCNPTILLLDEPTGSLDDRGKEDLLQLVLEMKNSGVAILAVTHDAELVAKGDTVSVLFDGSMSESQEPHAFLRENRFFTTKTVSVCRDWIDGAVTTEEALENDC